jgi:thioredoxin 1
MKIISDSKEFSSLIQKDHLTIVDFFAEWCGPCKMIAPDLEDMSETYKSTTFIKVDVDKSPFLAQMYGVQSMPTILFFREGQLLSKVIGADMESVTHKLRVLGGALNVEEEKLGEIVRDLSDHSPDVFSTLKSILQNIVNFPEEPKYQKIKTSITKVAKLLEKKPFQILSLAHFEIQGDFLVCTSLDNIKQVTRDILSMETLYNKEYVFDSDNTECLFSNGFEYTFVMNGKTYGSVKEYLKTNPKDVLNAVQTKFTNSTYLLEELCKHKLYKCNGDETLGVILTKLRGNL